jgi:glycosyltransferase involved in cell wall biosynthesis
VRRAVLVTNGLVLGGAETQTIRLAEGLRQHGYEVGVLSILPTAAFHDELDTLRVPVAELKLDSSFRSLSAIRGAVRVLRTWRPDALISFVYQANILGRLAGRLAGVPVIISSIRNERFGGPRRELMMRITERLCTVTTTNSQIGAERLVQRRVASRDRLIVIPNSISLDKYRGRREERSGLRRALNLEEGQFMWLAAGRLEEQKDYRSLLTAFAALVRDGARARLLIAGQGPLRNELEGLVRNLGLQEHAAILGLRRDIPSLLAASDALVLSSAWEGLPNIVMEAMASGRPVVATHTGGVPELVGHGETGYLVPPKNPAQLAQAMRALMALPRGEREKLGERGLEKLSAVYSADLASAKWLTLIDHLVNLRNPDRRPRPPLAERVDYQAGLSLTRGAS